jgi:hypothetical protein
VAHLDLGSQVSDPPGTAFRDVLRTVSAPGRVGSVGAALVCSWSFSEPVADALDIRLPGLSGSHRAGRRRGAFDPLAKWRSAPLSSATPAFRDRAKRCSRSCADQSARAGGATVRLKRSTQKMPFSTRRSSIRGTPLGLSGRSGLITHHSKSVRSYRLRPHVNQSSVQAGSPQLADAHGELFATARPGAWPLR